MTRRVRSSLTEAKTIVWGGQGERVGGTRVISLCCIFLNNIMQVNKTIQYVYNIYKKYVNLIYTFKLLEVKGLTVSGGIFRPGGQGREKLSSRNLPLIASSTSLQIKTELVSIQTSMVAHYSLFVLFYGFNMFPITSTLKYMNI